MVKRIRLEPIAQSVDVATNSNLLSVLLGKELDVLRECGGRGLCATCHVFIQDGMGSLSTMTKRETRTLEVITTCRPNSRLACQARVQGDGIVVEVPVGMYINAFKDLEALVGRRAEQPLLHPVTGEILVQEGKLITRSTLDRVRGLDLNIRQAIEKSYQEF